jgi:hypothetical protein
MAATDADFVTGHVSYDDHNDPQKHRAILNITAAPRSSGVSSEFLQSDLRRALRVGRARAA